MTENKIEKGGVLGYTIGHERNGYKIPDYVYGSEMHRVVKVLTIGAGVSGILMAWRIQTQCKNVELTILEKNGDIGGTWLENRYPGCACDVPSLAYQYAFALNAEWPKYLSESGDIYAYLLRVVKHFELRKYMSFDRQVVRCEWKEEDGEWQITSRDTKTDETFMDQCHILLGAQGVLNSWKWPTDVQNLDRFKGKLVHTARWPTSYQAEQWKQNRIAIIGSGASSIQTVPTMQPHAKHLHVYVRTPVWFTTIADNDGNNFPYTDEQISERRANHKKLVGDAHYIESQINTAAGLKAFMTNSLEAKLSRQLFSGRMKERIKDPELLRQMLPSFTPGCRRVTPGNPYQDAVQKENVTMHFCPVTALTETGVVGADGVETEVDTVVCATGFDVSYVPRFPIIGHNGLDLREKWKVLPEGYLGLAVPDMPNYFMFIGPTWPVENGSVMGPLFTVSNYVVQWIKKMQAEHIHSFAPKQSVTDLFNEHAQTWIKGTCWEEDCRSWYKNNETGRVNAVWPGSSLHYCDVIKVPRYEDFDIKYTDTHNMWAFLGLGFTPNQLADKGDLAHYISEENHTGGFAECKVEDVEKHILARESLVYGDAAVPLNDFNKATQES